MDWVPLWNRTLYNRKAQGLSGDVFKTWINLLCLASAVKKDGGLPEVGQIAFELRIDDATARDHLRELLNVGLIDSVEPWVFRIHDWDAWQLNSYRSTERVKRFREKKKQDETDETFHSVSVKAGKNGDPGTHETGETFHGVTGNGCNALEENRGEEKKTPLPPTGDDVEDFGRITLGDKFDLECIGQNLRGWRAAKYPDLWIVDAILVANAANTKTGGMASYITTCLRKWKVRGGPDPVEVSNARGPARHLPPQRKATDEDEDRARQFQATMRARAGA